MKSEQKLENITSKTDRMFLCSFNTDDECFYVGLGHRGQSQTARKSNFMGSDEYRPFQCCPTKLERATKVPKMTAQRLASKSAHEKTPVKSGHFEFSAEPSRTARNEELSKAAAAKKAASAASKASSGSGGGSSSTPSAKSIDRKDKKSLSKKEKAQKPGQKGLLGIGKVVDWL